MSEEKVLEMKSGGVTYQDVQAAGHIGEEVELVGPLE